MIGYGRYNRGHMQNGEDRVVLVLDTNGTVRRCDLEKADFRTGTGVDIDGEQFRVTVADSVIDEAAWREGTREEVNRMLRILRGPYRRWLSALIQEADCSSEQAQRTLEVVRLKARAAGLEFAENWIGSRAMFQKLSSGKTATSTREPIHITLEESRVLAARLMRKLDRDSSVFGGRLPEPK